MPHPLDVLRGSYLTDLLAQGTAISATAHALQTAAPLPPLKPAGERVLLTGMGSSLFALYPTYLALTAAGVEAAWVETAELVHALQPMLLPGRFTTVVAVSQSGRSAETVDLIARLRGLTHKPRLVGVTNTQRSPLALAADDVVLTRAGEESTVSCKTYVATLAALQWLTACFLGTGEQGRAELTDGLLDAARAFGGPADKGSYLGQWEAHVTELAEVVRGCRDVFAVGRGASLAAALTGGLILKESTRWHAEGMSAPAFRHGPLEMVSPQVLCMVLEGTGPTAALNRTLARDVAAAGGRSVLVTPSGSESEQSPRACRLPETSGAERTLPLLEILPVQMLSLAIGLVTARTPGVFERATKVTVEA